MFVGLTCLGQTQTVVRETFENRANDAHWHVARGFRIVDGEGVDGGRCLLFEQDKNRPVPADGEALRNPADTYKIGTADGGSSCFLDTFPVEPGRVYVFSVMIKGRITNNCCYAFFRWLDAEGRVVGSTDARPVGRKAIFRDAGTKGWERLTTASERIPSEARMGVVYLESYRTTTGRMAFDDIEVVAQEVRHLDRVYSSAYRDEASEGIVRFAVPYYLNNTAYPTATLKGSFSFEGKDGRFSVDAEGLDEEHFYVDFDVSKLAFGTNDVIASLKSGEKAIAEASVAFVRPVRPRMRRVDFDRQNLTLVDGKPIFPLGVFVSATDKDLPYIDKIAGGAFNCVIDCKPYKKLIDELWKRGLYSIPKPPRKPDGAVEFIREMRNHPGILAWYLMDEAAPGRVPEKLALYEKVRAADADHPALAIFMKARDAKAFLPTYDIASDDPYVINANHLGKGQPVSVDDYVKTVRKYSYGTRPVWQAPQAYSKGWTHDRGLPQFDRYPTDEELRAMSWQSIAGGANGLFWYSANQIFRNTEGAEQDRCWNSLVRVAAEIRSRESWLVSQEKPPVIVSHPDAVAVRTFRKGDRVAVLICGRDRGAVKGTVTLKDGPCVNFETSKLGVEWIECPLTAVRTKKQ